MGSIWARMRLYMCVLGKDVRLRGRPHLRTDGLIRIGDRVSIHSYLQRTQLSAGVGACLEIGDDTFVNNGVVLSARCQIKIGKRCHIAPQVVIMDCDYHSVEDRASVGKISPVLVGDDVWVATRATILRGVSIGQGAVVAAAPGKTHTTHR